LLESQYNEFPEVLGPGDLQKLQTLLSKSVKSFDPGTSSEAADLVSQFAANARRQLRETNPNLTPLQKAYGILSTAKKGADAGAYSDFAKIKGSTSVNKVLQNTVYSPQVQGGVNSILDFATKFQEGALGSAFQQAVQRGPASVKALHYVNMQRNPTYAMEYLKSQESREDDRE
jgi:hypothetical protein